MEPTTDRVAASVEQSLPPTVAMILYPIPVTSIRLRLSRIDVTKPGAILEHESAEPFVLELRHWIERKISSKVFSVGVELGAVAAFAKGCHAHLEPADSPRYADSGKRPVIPCQVRPITRAAGVETVVSREQVILCLGADVSRTLT